MLENAINIFDYLPIRMQSGLEEEYINYLWESFMTLSEKTESPSSRFAIMPFHMLFMLAVQYKALRISKVMPEKYKLIHTFPIPRLDQKALLEPTSPFTFSGILERSLFDIFKLVGANEMAISRAKDLVNRRNDLAHSKGVIESDSERVLSEYLEVLISLQPYFESHNDATASGWLVAISPEEDAAAYIENSLAASHLCIADFRKGLLAKHFPREDV